MICHALPRPKNHRMAARPQQSSGTIRTRTHVDASCGSPTSKCEVPSRKSGPVERRGHPSRLSFRGGVTGLHPRQDTLVDPACTIAYTSSIRTRGCCANTSWKETTKQAPNGAVRIRGPSVGRRGMDRPVQGWQDSGYERVSNVADERDHERLHEGRSNNMRWNDSCTTSRLVKNREETDSRSRRICKTVTSPDELSLLMLISDS